LMLQDLRIPRVILYNENFKYTHLSKIKFNFSDC